LGAIALLAAASAPLDQYFGKLKMSALRIRYEIVSIRDRYETHKILPEDAEHLASLTQDAFDDWRRKYPGDQWLASTAFLFAKLYAELPGPASRDSAIALYTFVKSRFPDTRYAAQSRDALHRGVPVRPDPAWAAQRRAENAAPRTALPSSAPSLTPSPAPSSTASAGGSPAPSP
jgi:hypothetical protein